jgi:putative membrane protein
MHRITIAAAAAAALTMLPVAAIAVAGTSSSQSAPSSSPSSRSLNEQDKQYLKETAQGALWEVQGGHIAQRNAAHPYTKAFGQRMITDHSKQYQDTKRTAAEVHVSVPNTPDPTQKQVLMLFSALKGGPFDCAYLSTEWADHVGDVNGTKLELAAGHNPEVKELAAKYLPVLEQHLALAEQDVMKLQSCGGTSSTNGS